MEVNPNIASAQEGAPASAPSGASNETEELLGRIHKSDGTHKLRKSIRGGKVQSHLRGAIGAVDALLMKCRTGGAYSQFRGCMMPRDAAANRAAVMLLRVSLDEVERHYREAEAEHIDQLRAEVAALEGSNQGSEE